MNDKRKKRNFIKEPEYLGGNKAFKEFIKQNLRYPEQAIENKIEGIVHLLIEVDDTGNIKHANIEKGIGFGCDEEALRLIKLMKFGSVSNKGFRLTIKKKIKIEFKLTHAEITLNYKFKQKTEPDEIEKKSFSYSIKFNNFLLCYF